MKSLHIQRAHSVFAASARHSACIGLAVAVSCTSPAVREPEAVGHVEVEISRVPDDVQCVRVVARASRTITRNFSVVSGDSARQTISGLPLGQAEFIGSAFSDSCAALAPASKPVWVSDPVIVAVLRGITEHVSLQMRRNGRAAIDVDFDDCAPELVEIEPGDGSGEVYPLAINDAGYVVGELDTGTGSQAFVWHSGTGRVLETSTDASTSSGIAINNRGHILVRADQSAFFWDGSMLQSINTLGGYAVWASGLNDFGEVVGTSVTAQGESHAFRWHADSGIADLGTLGGRYSLAVAVSANGDVIGRADDASGRERGFVWSRGAMHDLGTLGGDQTYVSAVNASTMIVGRSATASGTEHAFIWANGVMRDIGTLGGHWSDAYGINAAGQVVGVSETATREIHAFLWEGGTMRDLGTLGGKQANVDPGGINEAGQIAGSSETALGGMHAFLWEAGVMRDIGASSSTHAWAVDLNNVGQVVIQTETASGHRRAYVYEPKSCDVHRCGDGRVQSYADQDGVTHTEACDDGNTQPNDGCAPDCSVEPGWLCLTPGTPCRPTCGNGWLDSYADDNGVAHSEACDDGNTQSGDGCAADCSIERGWACEVRGTPCRMFMCGDGRVESYVNSSGIARTETCDDGNAQSGDGCGADCAIETGWSCEAPGRPCREHVCGDTRLDLGELCDDGNTRSGDGCAADCTVEPGWACWLPGPVCLEQKCGNGRTESYVDLTGTVHEETCDDYNTRSGDGCSATCTQEPGWMCGSSGCWRCTPPAAQSCGCVSPEILCGDECIDVSTDAANCGTCGRSCGPNEACWRGIQCVPEIVLDTPITDDTTYAAAWGSSTVLIAWADARGLYAARIRASDGMVLDPSGIPISPVTSGRTSLSLAFDGASFMVTWRDAGVWASRIREDDGTLLDSAVGLDHRIAVATPTNFSIGFIAAAFSAGNYLVAWSGACAAPAAGTCRVGDATVLSGASVLAGQRVRASDASLLDGLPAGGGAPIAAPEYVNALSAEGGNDSFVVVWAGIEQGQRVSNLYAAQIGRSAVQLVDSRVSSSLDLSLTPSLAFDGSQFLVTASHSIADAQGAALHAWRVRESDNAVLDATTPLAIAALQARVPGRTSTAFDGTNFLVAWPDARGGTFLARVRPSDGELLDGPLLRAGLQAARTRTAIVVTSRDGDALVLERRSLTDAGADEVRLVAKLINTNNQGQP